MDALEALKTRRAVREYEKKPVSREVLEDLVDCARLAATARNIQPWEFVVVTQPDRLRALAKATGVNGPFIADAAACVVVLCKDTKYYLEDGSAATQNLIVAARAHGLAILDGVHLDLSDEEGFRVSCQQGRELGFDGKTLIHPKTVEVANEVFSPGSAEIEQARKIIAAFEAALSEGKGVVVVDGKLVENLHVENARRLMALARAIEERTAGTKPPGN